MKHPMVMRLFENARAEICAENEDLILLPTRGSVQKAHRWIEQRVNAAVRVTSYHHLWALVVPASAAKDADLYWRFTGEGVSSRRAQDLLDGGMRNGSKSKLVARSLCKFTGGQPDHTFVFSSGMAAITAVLRALPGIRAGRKTLQIEFPYVDSLKVQEEIGQGVVYLNEANGESFDEALQRIRKGEFAAVFTEVPSNPLLRTLDVPALARACAEGATPLALDDSSCGPLNVGALRFADVVTGSLTKWVSGTGDVMAGAATVRETSAFAAVLNAALTTEAEETAPLYVADAEVLLSNMKGYSLRMAASNANALALTSWLAEHPAVDKVWHPSITTRAEYDMIRRKDGGYGGLLSFALKSAKKTQKFYDALAISKGPSFGTAFTLACPYTMLAHYPELEWAEACGVPAHLIRVSCGAEETDALLRVFGAALEA
ncbi:MAG: PLP-dependent transferase [Verrucomicrobiota bacterium]